MTARSTKRATPLKRHIICERDVGMFSLIQQVIAHIPWAVREQRVPVVYFMDRTAYWKPTGYRGSDSVWEYYFEPIDPDHPASKIPRRTRQFLKKRRPSPFRPGFFADKHTFVSSHFGDHPDLEGKTISIPYLWDDPDDALRRRVSPIIHSYIRPRAYLQHKANQFFDRHLTSDYVIGVHIRGTDAISPQETREHRQNSLKLPKFARRVRSLLRAQPDAQILVATDDESSLAYMKDRFGDRVVSYDSIRHRDGPFAGTGPYGWIMPAYITREPSIATQNGEEVLIEYLMLCRCNYLVHNASGIARTVLLAVPHMPHTNTHLKPKT